MADYEGLLNLVQEPGLYQESVRKSPKDRRLGNQLEC